MKILVTGKTGQLGIELSRIRWPEGTSLITLDRAECDISKRAAIEAAVHAVQPDLVINAAAYTAVDRAESEPEAAMQANGEGPAVIAHACREIGASLIHISTDYVFDGTDPAPYREDHAVAPLSVYGRTKAAGEAGIRDALERHIIIRTSWLFSSHGNNFVKTMLRLARQNSRIGVVADQRGAPTWVGDLASAIRTISIAIAERDGGWGTFHFTSAEPATWFEFAKTIFELAGLDVAVEPISTAEFGARAGRPANSVLDCSRIRSVYGIGQPCWRTALEKTLKELAA